MCNLYRMTKSPDEVAKWFGAVNGLRGANFGEEVYPGYPGIVIAEGRARIMMWGFPMQAVGKNGQKLKPRPVNNARCDKLDTYFWRYSFEERRCLIPATAWAEPEGTKGAMTRTWLSRPDSEIFAVAGLWRHSHEWGDAFAMVMTDSCGEAAECHTRMPVLLAEENWSRWIAGPASAALELCQPWEGGLTLTRTNEPWASTPKTPPR